MGEDVGGTRGEEPPAWVKGLAAWWRAGRAGGPREGVQQGRSPAEGGVLLCKGPARKKGEQGQGLWGEDPGERGNAGAT